MSTKIQLLALEELESGREYRKCYDSNEFGSPFSAEVHRENAKTGTYTIIGYIPADAIEFIPPDPDKALIEGWLKNVTLGNFGYPAFNYDNGASFTATRDQCKAITRSFLDYQRKQSK